MEEFVLPDCSFLEPEEFIRIMNILYPLQTSSIFNWFHLKNSGHVMTDSSLTHLLPTLATVEQLTLHGLYRLSDRVLSSCLSAASKTLRSLNFGYAYNCISRDTLSIIAYVLPSLSVCLIILIVLSLTIGI